MYFKLIFLVIENLYFIMALLKLAFLLS